MHSRQATASYRLDVDSSVRATAGTLGYPVLKYRPDTRVSEYLVLIDRSSAHDHQAALFMQLSEGLRDQGLHTQEYFYDRDPRTCWRGDEAPLRLVELQQKYCEHRLLILGDGDSLTDLVTGRLVDWATVFMVWADRAILTPVVTSSWGPREYALASEFIVLPAVSESLLTLAEVFGRPSARETQDPVFSTDDYGASIPSSELVSRIRDNMGKPLFTWLCACAIYPELHWDLTLHLASIDCMPPNLVTEANLLQLVRVPWFRVGFIPDETRYELIRGLDLEQERHIRTSIIGLLEESRADEGTFARDRQTLEIAVNRYRTSRSPKERRTARRLLRNVPATQADGTYVALRSLDSVERSPLHFLLPKQIRQAVLRGEASALGFWVTFRFVIIVAFLVLGLMRTISFFNDRRLERHIPEATRGLASVEPRGRDSASSSESVRRQQTWSLPPARLRQGAAGANPNATPATPSAPEVTKPVGGHAAPAKGPLRPFGTDSVSQRHGPAANTDLPDAPGPGSVQSPGTTAIPSLNLNPAAPPPPPPTQSHAAPANPTSSGVSAQQAAVKMGGQITQAVLIHMKDPEYPKIVRDAGAKGTVELLATIGADGRVKSVKVVRGDPMLVKAAQDAVKQWVYKPAMLNGTAIQSQVEVEVRFLDGSSGPPPTKDSVKTDGPMQKAELIKWKDPVYPKIARDAGIHGTVELIATVGVDGKVKSVKVVRGHPTLVKAAQDAVMQWLYKPTMLNGTAVERQVEVHVFFLGR